MAILAEVGRLAAELRLLRNIHQHLRSRELAQKNLEVIEMLDRRCVPEGQGVLARGGSEDSFGASRKAWIASDSGAKVKRPRGSQTRAGYEANPSRRP